MMVHVLQFAYLVEYVAQFTLRVQLWARLRVGEVIKLLVKGFQNKDHIIILFNISNQTGSSPTWAGYHFQISTYSTAMNRSGALHKWNLTRIWPQLDSRTISMAICHFQQVKINTGKCITNICPGSISSSVSSHLNLTTFNQQRGSSYMVISTCTS